MGKQALVSRSVALYKKAVSVLCKDLQPALPPLGSVKLFRGMKLLSSFSLYLASVVAMLNIEYRFGTLFYGSLVSLVCASQHRGLAVCSTMLLMS